MQRCFLLGVQCEVLAVKLQLGRTGEEPCGKTPEGEQGDEASQEQKTGVGIRFYMKSISVSRESTTEGMIKTPGEEHWDEGRI